MRTSNKNNLLLFVRIALTVILLAIIIKSVNVSSVLQIILIAKINYLLPAGFLILIHVFFKSYKWYLLANSIKKNRFIVSAHSYLKKASSLLFYLNHNGKEIKVPNFKASSIQIKEMAFIDRFSEFWAVFFFLLLSGQSLLFKKNGLIITFIVIVVVILLYQLRNINKALTRFLPFQIVRGAVRTITLPSWPLSNILLLLSLVSVACYFFEGYLLLNVFSPVSLYAVLIVFPFLYLANLLPFTFNGLCVREYLAVLLLKNYGIDANTAVAVSLTLFVLNLLIPFILEKIVSAFSFSHQYASTSTTR